MVCFELLKISRKGHCWLGFALCAALPVAVALAFRFGASSGAVTAEDPVTSYVPLILSMVVCSGLLAPLFGSLAIIDLVAGELRTGAMNLLLTRPVPRLSLVLSRYLASMVWVGVMLAATTLSALAVGHALFRPAAISCAGGTLISGPAALGRAFGSWLLACACSGPFVSLSTVVACLGMPVLSTLALSGTVVLAVCGIARVPFLARILFVRYIDSWHLMFTPAPGAAAVAAPAGVLAAYSALGVVVAAVVLAGRDRRA